MKLTTKGRYAVTALLDIALNPQAKPMTIAELSQRHNISAAYLERLAGIMRAKGILKSVRGPRGGYILARPATEITLADIIQAVGERIDSTQCQGKGNCSDGMMCLTHHLWDELNHEIFHFFQRITLSALVEKSHTIEFAQRHKIPIPLHLTKVEHA